MRFPPRHRHEPEPPPQTSTLFSHFGDVGDLVYALPTIVFMTPEDEPSELVLYPTTPDRVREPFTAEKVSRLVSLFEQQPYLSRVRFAEQPEGLVLDSWRRGMRRRSNLLEAVAHAFRQPVLNNATPWMTVDYPDEKTMGKAVIHRSERYHARDFPWKDVVNFTQGRAVFVGSPEEHQAFCSEFGAVPYHKTPTLLALARAIHGCTLFVGNQSTPRALAEAMKQRVFVEESPQCPNTHFNRAGAYYGRRELRNAQTAWAGASRFELVPSPPYDPPPIRVCPDEVCPDDTSCQGTPRSGGSP